MIDDWLSSLWEWSTKKTDPDPLLRCRALRGRGAQEQSSALPREARSALAAVLCQHPLVPAPRVGRCYILGKPHNADTNDGTRKYQILGGEVIQTPLWTCADSPHKEPGTILIAWIVQKRRTHGRTFVKERTMRSCRKTLFYNIFDHWSYSHCSM